MDENELIIRLAESVKAEGGRLLKVGGCVRDELMGLEPKDFDVEVYGLSSPQIRKILERFGKLINEGEPVGASFAVQKLRATDVALDVSIPRRERKVGAGHKAFEIDADPTMTPREAAERRDITINALAIDPLTGEVLDFFGGVQDLRDGVIRHTSAKFAEDPLRVLRLVQFAARFGFRVAPETLRLCRKLIGEYDTISRDRIWGEFAKLFLRGTKPSAGLRVLDETGWITFDPELANMRGVPQDPGDHPEGDVWTHVLLVTDAAADIAEESGLTGDERIVLMLAALCHDMGKASTTAMGTDGKLHAYGHAQAGAQQAMKFMDRIGAPLQLRKPVATLVDRHMDHMNATVTDRFVKRLSVKLAEGGTNLTQLARLVEADQLGRPPVGRELPPEMKQALEIAERLKIKDTAPKPILMGRHLIELDVPPGPIYSKVLGAVFEEQLDGQIQSLEEAKERAKHILREYIGRDRG